MQTKVKYSYFQVVNENSKTYLKLVKGDTPLVVTEVADYLTQHKVPFNISEINNAIITLKDVAIIELCKQKTLPIREQLVLHVSDNKMQVVGRFYPPSSDGGSMDMDEIVGDLKFKGVVHGINRDTIQ